MEDRVLMSTGLPDYHFTAPALVAGTTQHSAPSSIGAFTKTPGGTTQRTQPAQIDYGVAAQNQTAASAPSAVTIYSVVTIRNETNNIIYYSLQWPGSNSTDFSVAPYSSRIHWGTGENVTPTIKYDWSFAPGYQEQSYSLTSRDFAGGGSTGLTPSRNTDGMQYYFTLNSTETGLELNADVTLDKTKLAQYRDGVTSPGNFPRLMSNFEVLAPPTNRYNCIAWSLGYDDRWKNPITSPGPNKLAGMDSLYAQEGYWRLSSLDFTLESGYQKVVVYATTDSNGTITAVTHAAIQSSDGAWTSKLGQGALIKHLYPDDLDGACYGAPVAVYIRPN